MPWHHVAAPQRWGNVILLLIDSLSSQQGQRLRRALASQIYAHHTRLHRATKKCWCTQAARGWQQRTPPVKHSVWQQRSCVPAPAASRAASSPSRMAARYWGRCCDDCLPAPAVRGERRLCFTAQALPLTWSTPKMSVMQHVPFEPQICPGSSTVLLHRHRADAACAPPAQAPGALPVASRASRAVRLPCMAAAPAAAGSDFRTRAPKDVRVLVVGPTGYIGKYVVKELIKRGYNVVAFAREQAGIKGKMGKAETVKVRSCCGAAKDSSGSGVAQHGARLGQQRLCWQLLRHGASHTEAPRSQHESGMPGRLACVMHACAHSHAVQGRTTTVGAPPHGVASGACALPPPPQPDQLPAC